MPEALETLQQIATASDSTMLNPLYHDTEGPSLAFLTDLLAQPFCRAWYLHREHDPLAAVWYQCHSDCAEIIDLRVREDERRAGVATRLLRASFNALDGVDKVTKVRAGNTPPEHSMSVWVFNTSVTALITTQRVRVVRTHC